jgi:hypothetical protein
MFLKQTILTFVFVITAVVTFSQMQLQDPNTGKVFTPSKYSEVNGSPFMSDKWITGNVNTPKGLYKSLKLKLDAYSNTLYFNKEDEPYEFADGVLDFTLTPAQNDSNTYRHFVKGLNGPDIRRDQFLEVLTEGEMPLYKVPVIFVSEVNEINKGVIKTFRKVDKYYVLKNNNLQPIKLSKSDILDVVGDKKDKVEAFANTSNLSFKKESDVAAIFKYYNSLK